MKDIIPVTPDRHDFLCFLLSSVEKAQFNDCVQSYFCKKELHMQTTPITTVRDSTVRKNKRISRAIIQFGTVIIILEERHGLGEIVILKQHIFFSFPVAPHLSMPV